MPSLPHAKPLLATAAGELHLHPAVLAFVILAVTVLISRRMIPSLSPLVAPRPAAGEPGPLLHPTGTVEAAAAPPVSAPRSALPHLAVLCVAMGAVLHAEPLVAHASAELGLDPSAVACGVLAVATLFNWAIVSISRLIAARADEREPKTALPPPLLSLLQLRGTAPAASTVRPSSLLARSAFAVLAALVSASWFVEPFAAAAELRLPGVAVAIIVVLFAALFNFSVHRFGSFFLLPCRAPGAAAQLEGRSAIGVAVMSAGVAACLVAAAGSACVYAPAAARN